jgi:hypothetical protein
LLYFVLPLLLASSLSANKLLRNFHGLALLKNRQIGN